MNPDKKQQDENAIEQQQKDQKNEHANQSDGFRYDYDDSSDVK
ncbi:hypothetical protein QNH36_03995 [Mesobacillus sp. AQ2]|nr:MULTISPECIES: hypothetical protein [unclassified Mesobacillus]WHX41330.1 hypothetical protein QNH36_03995 [Mesobacillus sp. AQ2]